MSAFMEVKKEIKKNGWHRTSGYKTEEGRAVIYVQGQYQMYVFYKTFCGIPYKVKSMCFYHGYKLFGVHDFETGYTWYSYSLKKRFEEVKNGNT